MDINDVFGSLPQRPDTQDFWRLSEIILEMDGAMETAHTNNEKEAVWQKYMGAHCDHESIYYMALQRAIRVTGCHTVSQIRERFNEIAKLTTVYTEGFLLGCQYMDRGGHRD